MADNVSLRMIIIGNLDLHLGIGMFLTKIALSVVSHLSETMVGRLVKNVNGETRSLVLRHARSMCLNSVLLVHVWLRATLAQVRIVCILPENLTDLATHLHHLKAPRPSRVSDLAALAPFCADLDLAVL
jgi:hypothetical protein